MSNMLIFGMGYTASRLAERLRSDGWQVCGTRREASDGTIALDDQKAVMLALDKATHILSSVPPAKDGSEPVLERYGNAIAEADLLWSGYLSSTGVYGDTRGAWVDESAPIGTGRRKARSDADARWQQVRNDMHVFRLPGIYGPTRSPLERVQAGTAKRINVPDQLFSRIHVDDIVSAIVASFNSASNVFNITDDLPAAQHDVLAHAARLIGVEPPPLMTLEEANLSKTAMGFYEENRKVTNGKAKRLLDWEPQYRDYRSGLAALMDDLLFSD